MQANSRETLVKHIFAIFALAYALTTGAAPSHAEGDAKQGKDTFISRCWSCHSVEQGGRNKVGPNLFGLFGATAGKRAFSYEQRHSTEIKQSGIVWSEETLDKWLASPEKFVPGTKMPFVGFPNKTDRDDVIAYLKSVTQ